MNAKQFFDEVAKMRRLQKEYFRSRTSMNLNASKAQERLVDKEIERVNNLIGENQQPKQGNMFDKQ